MPLVHRLDLLLRVLRVERPVNFIIRPICVLDLLLMLFKRVRKVVLLEVLLAIVRPLLKHTIVEVDDLVSILLDALLQVKVMVVTILLVVHSSLLHAQLTVESR